jgi:MscS family membrane protein
MNPLRLPGCAAAAALLVALAAPVLAASQGVAPPAPAAATTAPAPSAPRERFVPTDARPFFEEHLPAPLLARGPRGLLWWQWVALPVLVVLAYVLGAVLAWLTRLILGHLAARTPTRWDDLLLAKLAGPLRWLWTIAIVTAFQSALLLDDAAVGVLQRILRSAAYLVLFWAGFRVVDIAFAIAAEAPWTRADRGLAGLLPLGRRLGKVLVAAIGLIAALNELGFQVASLLAGLGIGGIAIALAAQKTVEHLFGSVAIGVDQPFRTGDFVKIDDFTGTVETIGLRSTRFRTLDRTLVSIPNGKLADMKTETFAARDRIRLYVTLGLSYGTTAAQMREVLARIEAALRAHPRLSKESPPSVRFVALQASTLDVEVMAWFDTTDWNEFTALRQELFLGFMEIVERAGTSLAFPTQTVHVVSDAGVVAGERTAPPPPRSGA